MDFDWKPYVPVAKRRERAARLVAILELRGETLSPVTAARGSIAKTYWGNAWCQNLERYSDYSSRLPRGRTYLRNGSVIDLKIEADEVVAQVMGSSLYRIAVKVSAGSRKGGGGTGLRTSAHPVPDPTMSCGRSAAVEIVRRNRPRDYFGGSAGLRRESNRSPLAGCFLKAHPS